MAKGEFPNLLKIAQITPIPKIFQFQLITTQYQNKQMASCLCVLE